MDTDDLTEMAHETLVRAHAVSDVLRGEIGASATSFKTEDEFLRGTLAFLDAILADPEKYLESWNLLHYMNARSFVKGIRVVRNHVNATMNTPREQRGKPPFEEP